MWSPAVHVPASPAASPVVPRARPEPVPTGGLVATPSYQSPLVPRGGSGASTPLTARRTMAVPIRPASQGAGTPITPRTPRTPSLRADPRAQAVLASQPEAGRGLRAVASLSVVRGGAVAPAGPGVGVLYPEARGILYRLVELVNGARLVPGPDGPEVPFLSLLEIVRDVAALSRAFGPVMEFLRDEMRTHLHTLETLFRTSGEHFGGRGARGGAACVLALWDLLFGSDAASDPTTTPPPPPPPPPPSPRAARPLHPVPGRSTPRGVPTVQGMARWEASGRRAFRRNARGTSAVVAVGRLLDFLICFCGEYLDESRENLADVARAAYRRSLHHHHNFLMRKATGLMMTGMPERSFFVASIGMTGPEVLACMRSIAQTAPPIIEAVRSVERRCG
eukprot:tig00000692_g3245.t1